MKVSDNGGLVYHDGIIYRANKVTLKEEHEDGECTFGGFFEVDEGGREITTGEITYTLNGLESYYAQICDNEEYMGLAETLQDTIELIEQLVVGEVKE